MEPDTLCTPYTLLFNTKIYIVADKFDIPALKKLATHKYQTRRSRVLTYWNSPVFLASALLLWNNTMDDDRLLRNAIVIVAGNHIKTLLDRGEFVDLMREHGSFSLDIVKFMQGHEFETCKTEDEPQSWIRFSKKARRQHSKSPVCHRNDSCREHSRNMQSLQT